MDNGSISPVTFALAASLSPNQQAERRAEQREIIKAVQALNRTEFFGQSQELQFSLDRETKRPVLKIVDRQTGEVVTQVPPEHILKLARQIEGR
ncbi:MAG: flagellar protein FlaG [Bryobacteraceae bacterium]|nr:flagellar protein FlaG [Bryobacteraceae bacterium]MDW8380062.1 flagellar protein FlaG [Bryobacterales bacterium]